MTNQEYQTTLAEVQKLLYKCWDHCRDSTDKRNYENSGPHLEHNFPHQGGMIAAMLEVLLAVGDLCESDLRRNKKQTSPTQEKES